MKPIIKERMNSETQKNTKRQGEKKEENTKTKRKIITKEILEQK